MSRDDPFADLRPARVGPMRFIELLELCGSMAKLGALAADHVSVLVRETDGDPAPWIEFSISYQDASTRQFGVWRNSGKVFEADEHGAMGEEPVL